MTNIIENLFYWLAFHGGKNYWNRLFIVTTLLKFNMLYVRCKCGRVYSEHIRDTMKEVRVMMNLISWLLKSCLPQYSAVCVFPDKTGPLLSGLQTDILSHSPAALYTGSLNLHSQHIDTISRPLQSRIRIKIIEFHPQLSVLLQTRQQRRSLKQT